MENLKLALSDFSVWTQLDKKTVLLDGGATHCLRPMRSEEEWEKAIETPVFLASGTVTLRQVPGSETLITRDKGTQPIVPLAALVKLGIQVRWDEQGCEMKRPDGSKLPIYLDGGCPVMERWQGMELMAEVECFNSQKSGIRDVIATRRLDAAKGLVFGETSQTGFGDCNLVSTSASTSCSRDSRYKHGGYGEGATE